MKTNKIASRVKAAAKKVHQRMNRRTLALQHELDLLKKQISGFKDELEFLGNSREEMSKADRMEFLEEVETLIENEGDKIRYDIDDNIADMVSDQISNLTFDCEITASR